MIARFATPILLLLCFLSGFLALVYEVIWIRKLTLAYGATNIAVASVLAIFFGGLALGSFVFGRVAARVRNLIGLYGLLEIAIGAFALLFPTLLQAAELASGELSEALNWGISLPVRILPVVPLLLLPATLMGATIPILSAHFVTHQAHLSGRVGRLAGVNTLGGALGAFICGFYLIYYAGVDGTNYGASAANLGVGVAAWALGRRLPQAGPRSLPPPDSGSAGRPGSQQALPSAPVWLIATGFGVSGFCAIGLEVVWTRYLALFFPNSIHAYSTILAVFLLGLALGGAILGRYFDRVDNPVEWFGYLQLGIGLTSLAVLAALPGFYALLSPYGGSLFVFQFLFCGLFMLVPTTLMGAVFPLVARIVTLQRGQLSRSVGTLYAMNTAGAVAGSVLAGLVFLPWLGIHGSARLLAVLNYALGLTMALADRRRRWLRILAPLAAALLLGAMFDFGFQRKIPQARLQQIAGPIEKVVAVKEGVVHTVWVTVDAWERKSLWTNFSVMGRSGRPQRSDLSAQRVQGHIPMVLHPGEPREVLGIGFGTGQTLGAQLLYPIGRLDIVDISQTVVDLALEHFPARHGGLAMDRRARFIVDDGRAFLRRTRGMYDVITLEMPPQLEAGIAHFYTRDFYETVRARLRPSGVLAQWMPIYNVTASEARGMIGTLLTVFPQAVLWHNRNNFLLLGFNGRFRIDAGQVRRRLQSPPVSSDMSVSYLDDPPCALHRPECFLASFLMGPGDLAEFSRGASVYTDDRADLEFTWTQFGVSGPARQSLLVLENTRAMEGRLGNPEPFLWGDEASAIASAIPPVRDSYLKRVEAAAYDGLGTYYQAQGAMEQALAQYRNAVRSQPGFAQPHYNLGSLFLRLRRPEEALAASAEAIRIDPSYAEAHFNLGVAHVHQGRLTEALSAYREAARIRPNFAMAHSAIGRLCAQMGRFPEAIEAYNTAIQADPQQRDAFLGLAVLLARLDKREQANQIVGAWLENNRNDRGARELQDMIRRGAVPPGPSPQP